MKTRLLPLLAALFAATCPIRAATVNWTTSTVSAPSDVSTAGTLVGAMEVGGGTARTVNGVNFAVDPGGAGSLTLGSGTVQFGNLGSTFGDFWTAANPGGDTAYAAALDSGRWQAGPVNGTVTPSGLTVGRTYLVQLWIVDTRAASNARIRTVDGVATTSGGPNISTGKFIADAATQVITLADANSYGPQVNLLQVRDVTIMVTNTADSGAGSLRQAIADAAAGGARIPSTSRRGFPAARSRWAVKSSSATPPESRWMLPRWRMASPSTAARARTASSPSPQAEMSPCAA